jgi:hypothetical protein
LVMMVEKLVRPRWTSLQEPNCCTFDHSYQS